MRFRVYQVGELVGILLVLGSVAAQQFYLEPLKREIEWRLVAFNVQQSGQIQVRATYDARITLLQAMNAPPERIADTEKERDRLIARFTTADANIADYMIAKQDIEDLLQLIVMGAFAAGTLLAGLGRAMEMRDAGRGN